MADMTYRDWTLRLSKIVGIPDLESAPALEPNSWFLVPLGDELTSDETESLFSAVNRVLRPTYGSSFRQKVEDLETKSLLPLLYSLRLIAKDPDVRYSHFWPIVITKLFGETYDSSKFRAEIATAQTEAWRRYRVRSNRRLYEPSPSKYVNLAWPLCHAGLIDTVKSALSDFCLYDIRRGYTECKWSDDRADFDRFVEEFVSWAKPGNVVPNFVSNLKSETAGSILASMAVRYLRDNWSQIGVEAEATSVSRGLPTVFTFLTDEGVSVGYGASELNEFTKSFEILLGNQLCRVPVQGGGRHVFENRTCFTLNNLKSGDRALARFSSGGSVDVLPLRTFLPTPSRNQTMIFDTETRRIQRRLPIGRKVIVYTVDGPHADEIIEVIYKLDGIVEKSFSKNGYRRIMFEIPFQTRFLDLNSYTEKIAISSKLDFLLEISQPTKLFSSEVSTLGGTIIGLTDTKTPIYDSKNLPMLLIGGSSETFPITISLNGTAKHYPEEPNLTDTCRPLTLIRINPQVSGEIHVRTNDDRTASFNTCTSTSTNSKSLFAGRITLSVSNVTTKYGSEVPQDFAVETLSKRTFSVEAWPNAALDIVIKPEYLAPYTYNRFFCDNLGFSQFQCNVDAEVSGNLSVFVAYDSVIKSNHIQFTSSVYCERSLFKMITHNELMRFDYLKYLRLFERETQVYIRNVIQLNRLITDAKSPGLLIGKLNRSTNAHNNLWAVYVRKRGQKYTAKKIERIATDEYGYFAIPIYGENFWIMVGLSEGDQGWMLGKSLHTLEVGEVTGLAANTHLSRCLDFIPSVEPNLNEIWNAICQEPIAALVPNDLLLVCQAGFLSTFIPLKSMLRGLSTCRMSSNLLRVVTEAVPLYDDIKSYQQECSFDLSALLFSREVTKKTKCCSDSRHALMLKSIEVRNLLSSGYTTTSFGSVALADKFKVDEVIVKLSTEEGICNRCGLISSLRSPQKYLMQSDCNAKACIGTVSCSIKLHLGKDFMAAVLMNASVFLDAFRMRDSVKQFQSVLNKLGQHDIDQDVIEVLNLLESPAEVHKLELLRTRYKHVGMYFKVVQTVLGQELASGN